MQRFWALLIDFLLLSAVFFPVTKLIKGVWIMTASDHLWSYGMLVTDPLCVAFLFVIICYFVLLEGLAGATAGKALVGLRVIRSEGGKPGFGRSLGRNLLRAVDALPVFNILGVMLIVKSEENARLGDRVAGTRVITGSS
jgi:uncharacterized RDD family membrane protein YckC